MHGKVKGETPAGETYRAMDPVLLDWVAATASYGFLMAYDRFVHRLSDADKDRFMADGDAIGREFGADRKRVVWGKCVSVRVDLGGRRLLKKKKNDARNVLNPQLTNK